MEESWCKLKLNPPHKFIDLQPINSIDFQSATRPAMEAEAPAGRQRSARRETAKRPPGDSEAPGQERAERPAKERAELPPGETEAAGWRERSGRRERAERPATESGKSRRQQRRVAAISPTAEQKYPIKLNAQQHQQQQQHKQKRKIGKKNGKMERWKDGKMERWKDGKVERKKERKKERERDGRRMLLPILLPTRAEANYQKKTLLVASHSFHLGMEQ